MHLKQENTFAKQMGNLLIKCMEITKIKIHG